MFNRLRHNRLTSTLGKVIRVVLAFYRGQGLSMKCRIQHHLGSQETWPICLDIIPSHGVSSVNVAHSIMPSRTGPRVVHNVETSQTCLHIKYIMALALPCSCHIIYVLYIREKMHNPTSNTWPRA